MRALVVAIAVLPVLSPAAVQAQVPTAAATRDQLAAAYLRLDYAVRDRPPAPEAKAALNRAADRAGMAFLGGRLDLAMVTLDSLALAVAADSALVAAHHAEAERALAAMPAAREVFRGADGDSLPYRLHVPTATAPIPLVVALHGAGGNEHMFLEGYGAGLLRRLADQRGFALLSPFTNTVMRAPALLDRLLDSLIATHRLDPGRVYLLGHSLGAITAWRLATSRADRVAAVVCIAGPCGGAPPDTTARWRTVPPALVLAGSLDPIAAPARLEQAALAAQNAGVPVEMRVIPDVGHTLIVGEVLPDAIDWLLARRRAPGGEPASR